METITIKIPIELKKELKIIAIENNQTLAQTVIELIKQGLYNR